MKTCKACKKEKESTEYYMYSTGYLFPYCKPCARSKAKEHYKTYYNDNAKEITQRTSEYRKANLNKMRPWYAAYAKDRRKNDLEFRLAHNLRKRLSNYITDLKNPKSYRKPKSVIEALGCEVAFLIQYLESKFMHGMDWSNYGKEWEIDHIIPLSALDLRDKSDFLKANHYTNLQPLWKIDNRAKSNHLKYNIPTSVLQLR